MKVELHLHTSRYSACAANPPEALMRALIQGGYEAVYITEHDAVWLTDELAELQAKFPEIRIFPGVELTITSHHLLVLGTNDWSYLDYEDDPSSVLSKAREEGHATILAHPFRYEGGAMMLGHGLRPDAIELRSNNHGRSQAEHARAAAGALRIPTVNAGDVHALDGIGKYWIETTRPLQGPDDIRAIITRHLYRNRIRED